MLKGVKKMMQPGLALAGLAILAILLSGCADLNLSPFATPVPTTTPIPTVTPTPAPEPFTDEDL